VFCHQSNPLRKPIANTLDGLLYKNIKQSLKGAYSLLLFISMGWDNVSELRPPINLLLIPQIIWLWRSTVEIHCVMILIAKNRRRWREPCPSATSSTTDPTWTDPNGNPGVLGERPAANRLSHGTAFVAVKIVSCCHCCYWVNNYVPWEDAGVSH
jgi:hypothetical protein